MAECSFKLKAISDTNYAVENNIKIRQWIMSIFSGISLLIFIFGLSKWYQLREKIDK